MTVNKQTEKTHPDDQYGEDILDSDELFDLDMPLDEAEDIQQEPETEMLTDAPDSKDSDIVDSLQDLMGDFPDDERQEQDDAIDDTLPDEQGPVEESTVDAVTERQQESGDEGPTELNQASAVEETEAGDEDALSTLENDLEHLLDRNKPDSVAAGETFDQTVDIGEGTADRVNPEQSEAENMADMPVEEKTAEKPKAGMANSIMLTLGLIAILVASLAAWLGLDALQKASNLAAVSPKLESQIKALEKQQQQHNMALSQQLETMENRINVLTQVIASRKAEQWRTFAGKKPIIHAGKPAMADTSKTVAPQSKQTVDQQGIKKEAKVIKERIVQPAPVTAPAVPTVVAKPVTKPVIKPSASPDQLSMYEVRQGSVKGWVVNIFSVESKSTAERKIRQLKSNDINAKYVRVKVKGKTWYRIRTSGYKNERAAVAFKKFLKEYHGINAWHSYLK